MKVYEALAKAFYDEGTTDVFTMMGGGNRAWINELSRRGVRMHMVRHEGAGLGMADGYGRETGRPGIVSTTSGPGITQLSTTMVVASRARTPLVAFCGEVILGDDSDVQYFETEPFAAAVESGFVRILQASSAYDAVRRAFYLARTESRPVILSAPEDIQVFEFEDPSEYVPSLSLINDTAIVPAPDQIAEAVEMIAGAERVVVILGRGAREAGVEDLVLALQAQTGALITTSLRAKNWMSDKAEYHGGISGLFATKAAVGLLQQADCVIGLGAGLNRYTIEDGYLYPEAKFIQIDTKPNLLLGTGRRAECYVQADVTLALEALNRALEARSVHHVGFHTPEVKARLATAYDDPQEFEIEPGTVDPREISRMIDDVLPGEFRVVLSAGYFAAFPLMLLTKARGHIIANFGNFGAVGEGVILAIGAVIGSGNQPTVVIDGDAGFMMYLGEFETACRDGLPLCVVVMNDQALGAENHYSANEGFDVELTFITTPDLGAVARALGGHGALVESTEQFRAALNEFVARPRPTVIDVRIPRNVLSIPDRRLRHGMDV